MQALAINLDKLTLSALLSRFLTTEEEAEANRCRESLLAQHADPVIRRTVRFKMKVAFKAASSRNTEQEEGAEEIYCRSHVALARQMDKWRRKEANAPESFLDYVAVITYNEWKQWLHKNRSGLADPSSEVHYLLTRQPGFAVWRDTAGQRLAGYVVWRDRQTPPAGAQRIATLQQDPEAFAKAGLQKRGKKPDIEACSPVHLLSALLDEVGGPVEFDILVAAFADLAAFRRNNAVPSREVSGEGRRQDGSDDEGQTVGEKEDTRTNMERQQEQRDFLRQLWGQVKSLPREQRIALLQNLQDGDVRDLHTMGIATFTEIGEVLGKTPQDLARIWKQLPLEDAAIAAELQLTEAQVKNLRQAAYRTLGWRMRSFDRAALRDLWLATTGLENPRPAVALLYLRDTHGFSVLAMLPRESIANRETIARKIAIELLKLNAIWSGLPLGFPEIGSLLNRTPQEAARFYYEACQTLKRQLKSIWTES